jgi:eukaryotic-like serine/threonine-protein kinase
MNAYPSATDYYKAVQSPAHCFTLEKLRAATFATDGLGLPIAAKGSSAVVFKAEVDGAAQAVRCYIRNDASSRDRYGAFGSYLASHGDLEPHLPATVWLDKAIRVKDAKWPVLQMGWVDGRTLEEYVKFLVDGANVTALAALAARWRELIARMQNDEFAHGDLQHGNVMVNQEARLCLVDFDGIWIPDLAGLPAPTEFGHRNYQHPGRQGPSGWGRWDDTFSALVIYLSLVALAKDPGLWLPLYNKDNLLLEQADFCSPFATQAWVKLAALHDEEVDLLAARLQECCDPAWIPGQSLETLLEQGRAMAAAAPAATTRRWWENGAAAPAAQASSSSWQWAVKSAASAATSAHEPPTVVLPSPPPLQSSSSRPGPARAGPAGKARPSAGASWWGQPSAAQSSAAQPSAAQPSAAQPSAAQPSAAQPWATRQSATRQAAAQPSRPPAQVQRRIAGGFVLGVGIALVVVGAVIQNAATIVLVLAGLAAIALGGVQFVPGNAGSGKPPGRT